MPKVRRGGYTQTARRYAEDAYGRILGSAIAPHSITPDRLRLSDLSALSPDLGLMTAGTFASGTIGRGRAIIGDLVDGLAMRDATERTWLWFSNSGQYARFGYADMPGAEIVGGVFRLHGDALIDGTVTARKLVVGELAAGFLDADAILVGDGNPLDLSTVTGIVISRDFFGGRRDGLEAFRFDYVTGTIVTGRASDTTDLTYAELGNGNIMLSNFFTPVGDTPAGSDPDVSADDLIATARSGLALRSYTPNNLIGGYDRRETLLFGLNNNVYITTVAGSGAPAVILTTASGQEMASLSQQGLTFGNEAVRMAFGRPLTGGDLDILLDTDEASLRMGARGGAVLAVEQDRLAIYGGYIALCQPWPSPTDLSTERALIWFDAETRELLVWDTTAVLRVPLEVR